MSYPRKYPTTDGTALAPPDWNTMVDRVNGFSPAGVFQSPYRFATLSNIVDTITYYYACNAFQVIYGGPDGEGSVSGTNPAAVINAALADCYDEGGGSVFIKNDMGVINAPLLVKDKVSLLGYGKSSKITTTNHLINHIEIVGVDPHPNDFEGCVVSGLYLVGTETGIKAGIYATDVHNIILCNNWIDSCGYGIHLKGTVSNDADNNIIAGNHICFSAKHGIFMDGTPYETVQENSVYANILETQNEVGLYLAGAHNTICGNTIEESNTHGIYLIGKENTVTSNTIRESIGHGILVDGNNEETPVASGSGNIINGNIILDNDLNNTNTYDGISLIQDADDNVICGNVIRNNDRWQIYVGADCDNNIIKDNKLYSTNYQSGLISTVSKASVIKDNLPYNPVGIISDPYPSVQGNLSNSSADQAYPSNATKYTVKETPKTIVVGGGTISAIWINDVSTGLISGVFKLGVDEFIHVYWSAQPTINQVRAE